MTVLRTIALAASLAAVASTGVAGAAEAPTVSPQAFTVGAAPITIPGTGVKEGDYMGARAKLVHRDVTLEAGQKVRFTLRADKGRTIRGLANESREVGLVAVTSRYVGKREVVVRAIGRVGGDGPATARIHALTK